MRPAACGIGIRHRSPPTTADLTNPIEADEASLALGAEAYATCAVCHGDTGLGDGAAGAALDPAPVNIAHTSQMMSDAYFFWRISEGGEEFGTLMPAWKDAFDDETIWDLINYIQALGEGSTMGMGQGMGQGMGMGPGANPEAQAIQQAALLDAAIDQELITQEQADAFEAIHPIVDAKPSPRLRGTVAQETMLLETALAGLGTDVGRSQEQTDTFKTVRDAMAEANLLP